MAVSPPELYSASWCRRIWVANDRLSSSDHFGPKQLFIESTLGPKTPFLLVHFGPSFRPAEGRATRQSLHTNLGKSRGDSASR